MNTYQDIAKVLNINLHNCALIDDDPLVLRTANLCGLKTFLMKGSLFDELYCSDFSQFIDAIIDCFNDIIKNNFLSK